MINILHDYLEENSCNDFRFESLDNPHSIEEQVKNNETELTVVYTYYDAKGESANKSIKISAYTLISFMYKKLAKITSSSHHYEQHH